MTTADLIKWMEREAREAAWCLARDGHTDGGQTVITVDVVYYPDGEYVEVGGHVQRADVSLIDWQCVCEEWGMVGFETEIEVDRKHWAEALPEGV